MEEKCAIKKPNKNKYWKPLSKEKLAEVLKYKDQAGNDNIRYKEIIKQKLIDNDLIIHFINSPNLDESENDSYLGTHILPYYLLTDTQTEVKNYICYETSFSEVQQYNKIMKLGTIIFYIICENKTIIDEETGISRHDLLAALITDDFNWSSIFGMQIKLVSDTTRPVDNLFAARTLVFEQTSPNSIVDNKTQSIITNDR